MKSIILLSVVAFMSTLNIAVADYLGSTKIIEVLVVIDTHRLITDNYNNYVNISKDPDHPTAIGHNYAFMITNNDNLVSGQATADLHIKAISGDMINWYGTSESNNFDNQVIVYHISHTTKFLSEVKLEVRKKENVFPKDNDIKDLEGIKIGSLMISATVRDSGKVNYDVYFGIYKTVRDTGKREVYGYFKWDPTITIP